MYNGPLLCGFNVPIKKTQIQAEKYSVYTMLLICEERILLIQNTL